MGIPRKNSAMRISSQRDLLISQPTNMEHPSLVHLPIVWSSHVLRLETIIRTCSKADLPKLEWGGLFWEHRNIIWTAFNRQQRGENVMLIAEANQWPIGQVWVDLKKKQSMGIGVLWALRVAPGFHNLGLGSRLIETAGRLLARLEYAMMELGVEKTNLSAIRLYERLGFERIGQEKGCFRYTNPHGIRKRVRLEEWIYQRAVLASPMGN